MLTLDDKARRHAAESQANPTEDDTATSNPWVQDMYRALEERIGHELPNLIVDRATSGHR